MDLFNIISNNFNGFSDEEIKLAEKFNYKLKEKVIDDLVDYESEQYINLIKKDKEAFIDKMYFLLTNGIKGYKDMNLKQLIDIYVEKLGQEKFLNLIELVNK